MNHYDKEDDLPNTPGNELENVKATRMMLSTVLQETADNLNRSAVLVDYLYQRQQTQDNKDAVAELYDIHTHLGSRITQYDLAHEAAVTLVKRLFKETRAMAYRLQETSDELGAVEADVKELQDELQIALINSYELIFDGLIDLTGIKDWQALHRFVDIILGNIESNAEQRGYFTALLETCIIAEDEAATS